MATKAFQQPPQAPRDFLVAHAVDLFFVAMMAFLVGEALVHSVFLLYLALFLFLLLSVDHNCQLLQFPELQVVLKKLF